jgi:Ca2+-binding RTX toxin-like protein
MAGDIVITGFASDGTNLTVFYDVQYENVAAFNIEIYQSVDGVTAGSPVLTQPITDSAKLTIGSHSETIAPDFDDTLSDYFLLAKVDAALEVSETNEQNNSAPFAGGVFKTADGLVHVHGTSGGDTITISKPGAVDVALNGATYSFAADGVLGIRVRAHGGNDSLSPGAGVDKATWAFGGDGSDTLTGGDANDYLSGAADNDWLYGGYGDDALYGGDGDDLLYGGSGNDSLYGEGGSDQIFTGAAASAGYGGSSGYGGYGGYGGYVGDGGYGGYGDAVFGGEGNDQLYGDGGNDVLRGEGGNDILYLGAANDTGYGGYGDDVLWGGDGADKLYGDEGNDVLHGKGGADQICGGDGDDLLIGGGDADSLAGGAGGDTINAGGESGDNDSDHPVILNFTVQFVNGAFRFSGTVQDDDSLAGLFVTFGGLLAGLSIPIAADGSFEVDRLFMPGTIGTVSVGMTDREGLGSNTPTCTVNV